MLLALDIGNSCISAGIFRLNDNGCTDFFSTDSLICKFVISTRYITPDEYIISIKNFIDYHSVELSSVDCAIISSVVPSLTDILANAVKSLCGCPPLIVTCGIRTGFGIKIKNPEQLGADIVANATAAINISYPPIVILDSGTATTLTVVDSNRNLIGTIIMPGLKTSMKALSNSAAQLSDVLLESPDELIGRDTSDSIKSGVVNGHVFAIDGFIRNIREELRTKETGSQLSLIATGGHADFLIPKLRNKFTYVESLTLFGDAYLYQKNKNK